VLLNERVWDALRAAVARLAAHDEVEELSPPRDLPAAGFRHQPGAYRAPAAAVAAGSPLLEEHFGPVVLFLRYGSAGELRAALGALEGQLTATVHAQPEEDVAELVAQLSERAGRVLFDGFPTGVAVTHAMNHGGPYPACSTPLHTSVGSTAIRRFLRPIAFQNAPAAALPAQLRDENPLGIWRRVNGELTRDAL
jgi:NADP-dependent aldehyde dehydrogenase